MFLSLFSAKSFRILATMNPGGDFGKKELSPALRNRFTEIWVPALSVREDVLTIVQDRIQHEVSLSFLFLFSSLHALSLSLSLCVCSAR